MFNRVRNVIKNKNKYEKMQTARRRDEINTIKDKAVFKAKLYDELRHVNLLIDSDDVNSVIISIPDRFVPQFASLIYTEDLEEYEIKQVVGKANEFYVSRRLVEF